MNGAEAVANLPPSVRVGAFDVALEKWNYVKADAAGRYGEFSAHELVIRIRDNHSNAIKVVDTFVHEVNHAIFWIYGVEDADKEERTVNLISTAWTAVYRDNPWLIDWIRASLSP